jgi:hypothetical protein
MKSDKLVTTRVSVETYEKLEKYREKIKKQTHGVIGEPTISAIVRGFIEKALEAK